MEKVGSINTYLGLTKDESAGDTDSAFAQSAQPKILLLSVLNGNQDGLTIDTLQSRVGPSMLPDKLREQISDLLKRGLVQIKAEQDPLNPSVMITAKGQEQLDLWA